MAVPYTMEDFRRDYVKEHLKDLTPEERLEGLLPEEIERYLQRLREVSASSSAENKGRRGPRR